MRVAWLVVFACVVACGGPKGKVTVYDTKIEIIDPIAFVGDTAELAPASTRMLDAVATTLASEPSIKLVEVVVHGADKPLSAQRAKAIADQIVARKIAPARLRSTAGDEPATRVAFVIVERAAP